MYNYVTCLCMYTMYTIQNTIRTVLYYDIYFTVHILYHICTYVYSTYGILYCTYICMYAVQYNILKCMYYVHTYIEILYKMSIQQVKKNWYIMYIQYVWLEFLNVSKARTTISVNLFYIYVLYVCIHLYTLYNIS
jgi:hypothetical protein